MKKENKIKEKFRESKIYKAFRRLTSLGLAGALAVLFPNEIVAWLSAGAGILYGKGLINIATMASIVTFLGSAGGILIQKIVFSALSFLFSNIILKQTGKVARTISSKIKENKSKKLTSNSKKVDVKAIEPSKKEIAIEEPVVAMESPVIERPKQKTLGVHPSLRR